MENVHLKETLPIKFFEKPQGNIYRKSVNKSRAARKKKVIKIE